MQRSIIFCFICLFTLVSMQTVFAEIPQQMTYQGLLNESGVAVNANKNLTFRIYTIENGGTHLWEEQHVGVPIIDGLFQVDLGKFVPIDLDFQKPYWLAIQIDNDPELLPRLKINSSGYAYHSVLADSAETIRNSSVTTEKIADRAVTMSKLSPEISFSPTGRASGDLTGDYPNPTVVAIQGQQINATAPDSGEVLEWNGSEWAPAADDIGEGVGAGTVNRISKYISGAQIGDSEIYETGNGLIGIGDTTPAAKFTVDGTGNTWLMQVLSNNTSRMVVTNSGRLGLGTVSPLARMHVEQTGLGDAFRIEVNDVPRLIVSSSGNLGLGTIAPSAKLDVVGRSELNGSTTIIGPTISNRAMTVTGSAVFAGQMVSLQSADAQIAASDILEITAGTSASENFQFIEAQIGQNVKFRVDSDGDVRADGVFTGGGADFAEMIEVSSGPASAEPGDVMVIDPKSARAIIKSSTAHSSLVAGIYSTKPGFLGSERDWDTPAVDGESGSYSMKEMADNFNEIPMAVVGIVPCKVSAENGSIEPGTLLVTSDTPGHAMRDDDPKNGTILGKALESLHSGTGVIKVLVTLQ